MALRQLVYVSKNVEEFDDESLQALLDSARINNAALDVSGLLIYHEGSFIQALEGAPSVVEKLFEKIETDPRHDNTRVIYRGDIEERSFDSWSMGYKRTTSINDIPEGFHPFLKSGFRRAANDEDVARKALLAFKEGRFRAAS